MASPYNIMNQKVPSGVTCPSVGSSDFSHTGEEKQVTVKRQTYLPQNEKIMVAMSVIV